MMLSPVWSTQEFETVLSQRQAPLAEMPPSTRIHRAVQGLIEQRGLLSNFTVLLPSVKSLMSYFNCSDHDVIRGIQTLKDSGYEAIFPGIYGHISLYKHSKQP